jgi:hypothetical protein
VDSIHPVQDMDHWQATANTVTNSRIQKSE